MVGKGAGIIKKKTRCCFKQHETQLMTSGFYFSLFFFCLNPVTRGMDKQQAKCTTEMKNT